MGDFLSAAAKINLSLRLQGRRRDGYYDLHSLVTFARDFGDTLHIETLPRHRHDEILWEPDSLFISATPPKNNILSEILTRAHAYNNCPPLRIHLKKRIPPGGGLGGGSADAAALLHYLMRRHALPLSVARQWALECGSDIIACLHGRACFLSGRGENIMPITAFPPMFALLVGDAARLSTAEVFAAHKENFSDIIKNPPRQFAAAADLLAFLTATGHNDLWPAACRLRPPLMALLEKIKKLAGVRYASMSGSGAVLFGLWENLALCGKAAAMLCEQGYFAEICRLR